MRDLELDREAPQTPSADARHAERAPENHQNPNLPYDLNPDHHLNHRRPLNEHHLNRPLNAADVNHLLAAVTNEYRKAGWFVEVYMPQQALDQNELTLQVVEEIRGSGKPAR
jgi:hemolysin activation/secretion protein